MRNLPGKVQEFLQLQDFYIRTRLQGDMGSIHVTQPVGKPDEPHPKLNAGFVGLFASGHPAIFNWAQWNAETKNLNERDFEERCSHTAGLLTSATGHLSVNIYAAGCSRTLPGCQQGVDTDGSCSLPTLWYSSTALNRCDNCMDSIGEWSSRVLFPPPDGQWPRHGHPQCIGEFYVQRAPSRTAWDRACFKQGALASLLYLPGIVPVRSLWLKLYRLKSV